MSGWASLSGYLHLKPGGGPLSILKAKKRMWCVLEESQGRLLYFKSEDDARSKPPLGYVELRGAAITLDMDNHNQFVILVDNKDVMLTAENHESMMIWLMALQARRDQFTLADKSRSSSTSTENEFDIDQNFLNVVESRERVGLDLYLLPDGSPKQYSLPPDSMTPDLDTFPDCLHSSSSSSSLAAPIHRSLSHNNELSLSLNQKGASLRHLQHPYNQSELEQQQWSHRSLPQHHQHQQQQHLQHARPPNPEGVTQKKRQRGFFKWLRKPNQSYSASDLAVMRERADQYLLAQGAQLSSQHKPLEGAHSLNTGADPFPSMGYLGHSPEWRRDQLRKMGNTIDSGHPSEKMHLDKDRSRSLPPLLEDPPGYALDPSSRNISASVEMAFRAQQYRQSQHQQQQQHQLYHQLLPVLQLPDMVLPLDVASSGGNSGGDDRGVAVAVSGSGGGGGGGSGGGGGGASLASFVGGSSTSTSTDTSDDVGVEGGKHHHHNNHKQQQQLLLHNNYTNSSSSSPGPYQNKHHHKALHRAVVRSVSDRGSRNVGSLASSAHVPTRGDVSPQSLTPTSVDEGGERVSELEKELIQAWLPRILHPPYTFDVPETSDTETSTRTSRNTAFLRGRSGDNSQS
ncbi:hypothetical protein RRG08_011411 [Elysia crispata]|uniref:PH domain-containing protein n=1 Tax=Elysia crispata TaxID=231223 RepID=A0AAE1AYX8_9GAST|nr:hypothetical protein RRG08_011411 [Elysia crispata]